MTQPQISRRAEILRVAAVLFAEKGFEPTTTRDIGKAAGILPGSLYHHFSSKEAMLDEILASFCAELVEAYQSAVDGPGTARDALRRLVTAGVTMIRRHPAEMQIVNSARNIEQLPGFDYVERARAAAEEPWRKIWEYGIEDGSFRPDLDPRITHSFVWGGLMNVTAFLVANHDVGDEDAVEATLQLVLRVIQPSDVETADTSRSGL